MNTIWVIVLGVVSLCICTVSLVLNIIGYKDNYKDGNKFYVANLVLIIIMSVCILFNIAVLALIIVGLNQ